MIKTKKETTQNPILMDKTELKAALCCGMTTAEKIAAAAGARMKVGRRVLYDRARIIDFLANKEDKIIQNGNTK